jgi:recombination DNA repair RAD52 pathway protein
MLTSEQVHVLLQGIKPHRVKNLAGMSHLEGYDVRAMLTRIFGFGGWDEEALEPTSLLYDELTSTKAGKPAYKVAYRASRRLVIRDPQGALVCHHDGSAVGESTMPDFKRGDGHDMAIKTAETQALKRAAINLGDQFGLSLYNNGSTTPLVQKVVGMEET